MKKEQAEPLIELLYQEFPNKDPVDIERIINIVKKWLEQRLKENEEDIKTFEKMTNQNIPIYLQGSIIILKELIHKLSIEKSNNMLLRARVNRSVMFALRYAPFSRFATLQTLTKTVTYSLTTQLQKRALLF